MGLLCMTKFVNAEGLMRSYQLSNTKLIVDGNCCGKWAYCNIEKDPAIGGDYEDFAKYLKKLFTNFKNSNVSCYVLFYGGHNAMSIQSKIQRMDKEEKNLWFVTTIMIDVLNEMEIPHATCCTDEADDIIIALAKFFECPILSEDSDFFLSAVPIISLKSCVFVPNTRFVKCEIFKRDIFLQKYGLRVDLLPIFSMLLQRDLFEFQLFQNFFLSYNITRNAYPRIQAILTWLRSRTYESAVSAILQYVPVRDRQKCLECLQYAKRSIFGGRVESYALKFMIDSAAIVVKENDPNWFEKGVLLGHVSQPYIDIYKNKIYMYTQDFVVPYLCILRYAFDLLTGFSGEEFMYVGRSVRRVVSKELSISKPNRGRGVPFTTGWSSLPDYFEHFVRKTLPGLQSAALDDIPSGCRLWLLALVWWTVHTAQDYAAEVHCLLLCRARVAGHCEDEGKLRKRRRDDCSFQETVQAFDQFQYILDQFNCLNRLCAAPYDPVRLSESYCDSLARGALAKIKAGADPNAFVLKCLHKSESARELYKKLLATYKRCVKSVSISNGNS